MKFVERASIPHYVRDWSKHNPPYISPPTLLAGNSAASDFDNIKKPLSRDRSSSVGNNRDPVSATCMKDENPKPEYKTHVLWHDICDIIATFLNCFTFSLSSWTSLINGTFVAQGIWNNRKELAYSMQQRLGFLIRAWVILVILAEHSCNLAQMFFYWLEITGTMINVYKVHQWYTEINSDLLLITHEFLSRLFICRNGIMWSYQLNLVFIVMSMRAGFWPIEE